jgi:uncharacterized protein YndB with AHSA1/START domain
VGGTWDYVMHGPDGVHYPNLTKYLVVEPLKRLEYDHGASEKQKPLFRLNVVFSEKNGKTTMKMSMTFESSDMALKMSGFIKQANGNSTWDRLGEYLEEKLHQKKVFILNRVFSAPINVLYQKLTDPKELEKWQPPTGFSMKVIEGKVEDGNHLFYEMGNNEFKFFGRSCYQKIIEPTFIAFTQEFCDEKGQNTKHPGAPVWPKTWLTSFTLTAEENGITRLTLTSEVCGDYSHAELEAFIKERAGMSQGWNGSLDRLDLELENQNA